MVYVLFFILMTDRKEYQKNYQQKWKKDHPDYFKNWRLENFEHYTEYNKKWKLENPEKIKQWYVNNRQYSLSQKREKIECLCGIQVSRSNISRHKKSKKHLEWEYIKLK